MNPFSLFKYETVKPKTAELYTHRTKYHDSKNVIETSTRIDITHTFEIESAFVIITHLLTFETYSGCTRYMRQLST